MIFLLYFGRRIGCKGSEERWVISWDDEACRIIVCTLGCRFVNLFFDVSEFFSFFVGIEEFHIVEDVWGQFLDRAVIILCGVG